MMQSAQRSSRPVWWAELLLVLGGYGIYHEAQIHSPTTSALRHGWDILQVERWAHIGFDGFLNRLFASSSWLAVPAEYYYATLHFLLTVAVLVWLWVRHPETYREARRVIVAGTLIALSVFWAFPAAPPRMFPQAGFIDTSLRYRIPLDFEAGKASHAADLYAAMPSLHIGWSLWVAWAVWRVARDHRFGRLVWAYPALTALVVMGTGNHSALDLAGGAAVMLLGAAVAVWLPERFGVLVPVLTGRGWPRRAVPGAAAVVSGPVVLTGRGWPRRAVPAAAVVAGPEVAVAATRRAVLSGRSWPRWAVPAAVVAGPVVLVAVLAAQPHLFDGALDATLRARPVWLIAAVGAEIASMSAFSRLQVRALHMTGYDVRHRTALAINYGSNAIAATIPIVGSAAGTANTWRQYQRRGAPAAAVTWALATAGVLSALTFSLLMATAAVTSRNSALAGAGAGVTAAALALAVGYMALTRAPAVSERIIGKLKADRARHFVETLTSYRVAPASLMLAGGAGFLNWALDVACLGLAIHAVGGHLPVTVLVVVWAGAGAASSLSFTPSGLGVVEPILVAGLAAGGLHHTSALAATALYRLISFVLVAAAGWVIQLSLSRRSAAPATIPLELSAVPARASRHPVSVQAA